MTTVPTVPAPGKLRGCPSLGPSCGTKVTLWGLSGTKWGAEADWGMSLSPLAGMAHKSSALTINVIFVGHTGRGVRAPSLEQPSFGTSSTQGWVAGTLGQ